jgi:3',5'-cyclic-AMP phosphodiesterase
MVLLAQISDLHLDRTSRATSRAVRVMDYLRALPRTVDALLVTGDIADHGHPDEYEEAAHLLDAPFPVLTCPGNHDVRSAYRKALLGTPAADGPINRAHQIAGVSILMCDSSIPGRNEGLLDEETLSWLDTRLREIGDSPVLIAFHHPPVVLHHPLADGIRLQRAADFAAVISAHSNVVAVLTGNAHTAAVSTFAGRPLIVSPAVAWTLRMAWEGDQPVHRSQPPGLAFHVIDGEHNLTTHFRVLAPEDE